jgi:uncharacterized protein (TIGR02301 family)
MTLLDCRDITKQRYKWYTCRVGGLVLACILNFAMLTTHLYAQPKTTSAPVVTSSSQPVIPATPDVPLPPYARELQRLAYLLGALSYLQTLCMEQNAGLWANQMQALIDSESATPSTWRNRLTGAYNQGVQDLMLSYRTCTSSARALAQRHANEGQALSRALERKFSG